MPKCTINGKEVEVKDGATVIEAFKASGQDIAHYCWHPGLSIAGVCRLCMIEVEGNPRLQIACNTTVQEGMVVNNNSEKVKETVRWGMDFHLINHPLDCPICDQAGECGLQEQYMRYGAYDPEMAEPKVKKRKVVDLGPTIVLDSERCILCSRCVRFTDEVSETRELGIFNRGDRSEVGTFDDKPLDNDYSLNTVDICPVGALTSKDFRFRQRVWYLKNHDTICTGCSTGCSVNVYYNEEGLFRVKPRENQEVNGYWMCDKGRETYKFVNQEVRLLRAQKGHSGQWKLEEPKDAVLALGQELKGKDSRKVGVVVTGQYSNEEYESVFNYLKNSLGVDQVYHWINNPESFEDFDEKLIRGDKNPNTKGLLQAMDKFGFEKPWTDLESKLGSAAIETLIVLGPENQGVFPDFKEKVDSFSKSVKQLVWIGSGKNMDLESCSVPTLLVPTKTFFEKDGTYVNHKGMAQSVKKGPVIVPGALTLTDVAKLLSGDETGLSADLIEKFRKTNFLEQQRGQL